MIFSAIMAEEGKSKNEETTRVSGREKISKIRE